LGVIERRHNSILDFWILDFGLKTVQPADIDTPLASALVKFDEKCGAAARCNQRATDGRSIA
jgi:hypothetical protein